MEKEKAQVKTIRSNLRCFFWRRQRDSEPFRKFAGEFGVGLLLTGYLL